MKNSLAKTQVNSLQKFTSERSVHEILSSTHKLTEEDISSLSPEKREELYYLIKHKLKTLDGEAHELFYYKVQEIISQPFKNATWEKNHTQIKQVVKQFIREQGKFPTITDISEITTLSRVTVTKHFKDIELLDSGKETKQMMQLLFEDFVQHLFTTAYRGGDMKVYKLLVDIMLRSGVNMKPKIHIKNQQNNFFSNPETRPLLK